MVPADIRRFVQRDFAAAAAVKAAFWAERKRGLGPAEGIRVADELRRQVLAQRAEWPTPSDRAIDLACHVRVADILRRASAPVRR